jgi:hypothetical protein
VVSALGLLVSFGIKRTKLNKEAQTPAAMELEAQKANHEA